jgi:hypothetical protein
MHCPRSRSVDRNKEFRPIHTRKHGATPAIEPIPGFGRKTEPEGQGDMRLGADSRERSSTRVSTCRHALSL